MEFWLFYLLTGIVAGFLAGLLGVGGGLVIVPVLTFIFTAQHFPASHILHLALGTSLASILFTSVSSLRAHHAHGAVNWQLVRGVTPGILAGTFLGTVLAAQLSSNFLKGFFVMFVYYVATQMLLNIKPKPTRQLPGWGGLFGAGSIIGGVSSLVGIGGGTLSVPFMTWCNIKMHQAIGTSAAIGFPIALAGAAGYIVNGLGTAGLPEYSLGFVYLPALAGLVLASVLTAQLGARLAHRLPVPQLKKIFAALLYVLGTRMLVSMF
ncbi:MAG: sulfite exporter TauE/SafE family protein [Sulfurimicrobium sp.]|nr:sulfite exporter TauE/SafE family protein [Sulfurimicrobium sp.]MDP1703136.1 sulfite exporter TauE/SafE family protein [Sulfurimicrobium sp.]MDP2197147.1 sulfite exporter TauE/SafE family protein [Sulfurimicrobium sp.]MDP3688366.1 sulfite exporter TauE/SafE family protein [Sulfurimicrobium sp.]